VIPLCRPDISQSEINAVIDVLKSGWLTHGPKVEEFEKDFAQFIGVNHAVALNSATSALHLAIEAQNLKGEVIVPSFTFVASANAIIRAGCTPVFVDIEQDSRMIDPKAVESAITPKTVAIMPVHFAGRACAMAPILKIANKHHLAVIEDSAEAIGATDQGRYTGSFGTGCFSFFPSKNLTCGEGGMLTTNDEALANRVRCFRGHGIPTSTKDRAKSAQPWKREAVVVGYNFRMADILAAIGIEQLKRLPHMNAQREAHANYFHQHFDLPGIKRHLPSANEKHVYQMYTLILDPLLYDRDKVILALHERKIMASVHFDPPIHLHPYYQDYLGKISLPVTENVSKSIITLPIYPQLTKADLDQIVEAFRSALEIAKLG